MTVLSNCTLAFIFNKALWGVGSLAEGHRQRAVAREARLSPESPTSANPILTTETRRTAKIERSE